MCRAEFNVHRAVLGKKVFGFVEEYILYIVLYGEWSARESAYIITRRRPPCASKNWKFLLFISAGEHELWLTSGYHLLTATPPEPK